MNDNINVLLEVLEEIKQQNREIMSSLSNRSSSEEATKSECSERIHIEGLTQQVQQQIRFNNEFKEELVQVLTKLGGHIHEMKSGIAEVRTAQEEATCQLIAEMQTKQSPPEVKVTKFYLLDVKRWAEWIVWGILIASLISVIAWATHLYGVNQTLDSHALRYRAIRMELGAREPSIAQLDSLFSAKDTEDSIARLRTRVLNYEQALERQAELLLQQQRLSEEQASLSRQLQH